MGYKFGFECPLHPGRDHLCMLAKESAKRLECLQNPKYIKTIPLEPCHKVWFTSYGAVARPSIDPQLEVPTGGSYVILQLRLVNHTKSCLLALVVVTYNRTFLLSLLLNYAI